MADTLQAHATDGPDALVAALLPHAETPTPDSREWQARPEGWQPSGAADRRGAGVVSADVGDDGISRLAVLRHGAGVRPGEPCSSRVPTRAA
jgi:hypothetical protein